MYPVLLGCGLLIGAVFLVALLIGDRKEAKQKALQEQIECARKPVEGAWPPPPRASAAPPMSVSAPPPPLTLAPGTSRKLIGAFFRYRFYAGIALTAAYVICSAYPHLPFGGVLVAMVLVAVAWAIAAARLRRNKR